MSDFVTADIHNHHAKILEWCKRPWSTKEEMTEGIIERWNSVVSPWDRVFILGDLIMDTPNFKKEERIIRDRLQICRRLQGVLMLVPGNHDPCHPLIHPKKAEYYRQIYAEYGVHVMSPEVYTYIDTHPDEPRQMVLLHHFPYQDAITEDTRYQELRPSREMTGNMPLIHGHVHQEWKQQGNMINAGLDVWDWKPVPIETIIGLLQPYFESSGGIEPPEV